VRMLQANPRPVRLLGSSRVLPSPAVRHVAPGRVALRSVALKTLAVTLICSIAAFSAPRKEKDSTQYGAGLIVNIPFPEAEVEKVVEEVIQNGIIRGTKEYNKDEYISGANPATSTKVFPESVEGGGKVYYKVRLMALDPRNFKDSSDVGTLAVRYVVQAQGDKNTVLRIDARFVEDFRRTSHASNGSVEGAEYKSIHDQLESIELMQAQTAEALKEKEAQATKKQASALGDAPGTSQNVAAVSASDAPSGYSSSKAASLNGAPSNAVTASNTAPSNSAPLSRDESPAANSVASEMAPTTAPVQTIEQRVQDLRRQVQRLVKSPGAALKSAPFHTATTLQSLPTGTEVLIVVSTTYWLGVETHEGQHGWILRDELELLP
jgi:polyhydroxyalkanoate synthesis regulator phasin